MSQDVRHYLRQLTLKTGQKWQVEVCETLRQLVKDAVPDAVERIQYGKPHYLKDGQYIAIISANKNDITFLIFNAPVREGTTDPVDSGKKIIRIRASEAKTLDCDRLTRLLQEAAGSE